ncbi:glycosyltransferase family 4 protein [Sporofaciens sp. JLR.KK001]|jgi:glycosyltransferase involved in cell wall biosynthesis|uniref:glycosyltransferase family 4 protein n=1 Tax=Sporofaciens sp. JLR.KK001 TaxID=3112621 RepID=UPI002FEFF0B3
MKKALQLASVASMIDQFNIPNIKLLRSIGYKVDVVADFTNPGNISIERARELIKQLESMDVRVIDIAVPRSLDPKTVISAYRRVRELVTTEHYNLIHCHSPIGGAIVRLAAKNERKKGTKVIYTAHGFHFYNGAPLKNWILFYPVEKWLSRYTDILITINQEDYKRASGKFYAKKIIYVPGIGVDTEKFGLHANGSNIRKELGIKCDDIMFLSVGEFNTNKNHEVVIRAMTQLEQKLYYIIVGKGNKENELKQLIIQLKLQDRVKLVGFRNDIADIYNAADVFIFPSFREGLSVSLMEAMASGLPVVCSRIRGNIDLIDEKGGIFFNPSNVESVADSIHKILKSNLLELGKHNFEKIKSFDLKIVEKSISEAYGVRVSKN